VPGLLTEQLSLGGKATEIARVREGAAANPNILLIDFPAAGQTTTDYEEFRGMVAKMARGDLRYVGIALRGPVDVVRTLTKRLSVLR
jgi:ABC-type branched-subunit amino acid transport system ATPase component